MYSTSKLRAHSITPRSYHRWSADVQHLTQLDRSLAGHCAAGATDNPFCAAAAMLQV